MSRPQADYSNLIIRSLHYIDDLETLSVSHMSSEYADSEIPSLDFDYSYIPPYFVMAVSEATFRRTVHHLHSAMFDMQLGLVLNRIKSGLRIVDFGLECQISVVKKQSRHCGCLLRPTHVFEPPNLHHHQGFRPAVDIRHGSSQYGTHRVRVLDRGEQCYYITVSD